jgi:uncharacterized delta-60 repeat protein
VLGLRAGVLSPLIVSQTASHEGDFAMWPTFISLCLALSGKAPRRPAPRRRPAFRRPAFRPRVEAMEERCLLTAGALDPTFGNGAGYVTTSLSHNKGELDDFAYSALIRPDGKIIAVGDTSTNLSTHAVGLARYNPNGSLDPSFGNAGEVIGPASVQEASNIAYTPAALYSTAGTANDGKIVVGGLSGGFSIARYNANGTLDTSFGSKGIATANFGTTSNYDVFFEVIQPDGKIVALGQTADYTQGQMARFNADGSLDTTFGQGGMVTGPVPDPFSLLLQPDGKLVMVGDVYGGSKCELARYNADGTLDTSFGNGGVVITSSIDTAYTGAIYPTAGTPNDGKIIVEGYQPGTFSLELARYNPDGSLDGTFGNGGLVITPASRIWGYDSTNTQGLAIQGDGRVVVTAGGPGDSHVFNTARYNIDGSLDSTFGSGGIATTSIGLTSGGQAVALQSNNDIVVAGWSFNGSKTFAFAVARYLGGPTSGPSFSVTGFPSNTTAGVANTITVTAETVSGNPNPGYTGTIHFTSSDLQAGLPADYTFTGADQGVHTFSVTLKTAGFQEVSVTDVSTGYAGGDGGIITVNPASASQLVLSGPVNAAKGSAYDVTVTVEDAYGNVVTGYMGTVHFSSSDSTATLPANYTFTAADAGVHTFVSAVILRKRGKQTITVIDTLDSALTATDSISVV